MNRTVMTFFIVLCLSSASSFSALAFETKPAKTVIGTVYIRADGRVEGTTSIQTADNVTYVLLDNINDSIAVERDNIIIDGEGYTVQGSGARADGFYWSGISNVTLKNTSIKGFYRGISTYSSSSNSIRGNSIANNYIGIDLFYSSNNNISGNNIANNDDGVWVHSPNNSISGNNITANNDIGILLLESSRNISISGNNIANNAVGIVLRDSLKDSISGNNITNNGFVGVWFMASYYESISGNSIANNSIGIYLPSLTTGDPPSKNNNISRNNITNNGEGIYLDPSSNNNSIIGNNFTASSSCGISLYSSSNTSIIGNTFTNDGLAVFYSYQNFVDGNTVNGKPLVYLEGTSNYSVSDAGQVILVNCDSIRVEDLNLSKASHGVQLLNTTNSIIARNSIAYNWIGISLYSSLNNSISGNNITNSGYYGIDFESSSRGNNIVRNNIAYNHYGIGLNSSSDNIVYHNNFQENTRQAHSIESTNVWDDGYPSGGNYWSDCNGTDSNHDGIGDTPYIINAYNIDHYPLVTPYIIPEFPSVLSLPLFLAATLFAVITYRRKHIDS